MDRIGGGILGLCIGDALGVPVEFSSREALHQDPVTDMRGFGTYQVPAGSWSDDSTLTLILADSIANQGTLDFDDIMRRSVSWIDDGAYTPHGELFDIGSTTQTALVRFATGIPALECGLDYEENNGNGSLMRVLPAAYYLYAKYGADASGEEAMDQVHKLSRLTHAHPRSQIACGLYIRVALLLLQGLPLAKAVDLGIREGYAWYQGQQEFAEDAEHYRWITETVAALTPESAIKSSGYVVDTLEAAFWCLLTTDNYRDCVLRAVNLGGDTDTVAAVAGGLAGLYYGTRELPMEWIGKLARMDLIADICDRFKRTLRGIAQAQKPGC